MCEDFSPHFCGINGSNGKEFEMTNIIGGNIKELREKMGFSQMSIARFLNVDQSMISKIEKGERKISSDMLEKLACLLGVPAELIIDHRIETTNLSFAFRTGNLTIEDMETISVINRIALNSECMAKLLEGADA